jgi:hypothetical protein
VGRPGVHLPCLRVNVWLWHASQNILMSENQLSFWLKPVPQLWCQCTTVKSNLKHSIRGYQLWFWISGTEAGTKLYPLFHHCLVLYVKKKKTTTGYLYSAWSTELSMLMVLRIYMYKGHSCCGSNLDHRASSAASKPLSQSSLHVCGLFVTHECTWWYWFLSFSFEEKLILASHIIIIIITVT